MLRARRRVTLALSCAPLIFGFSQNKYRSLYCIMCTVLNRNQTLFIWFKWTIQQNDFFWIMDICCWLCICMNLFVLIQKKTGLKEANTKKKTFPSFRYCLLYSKWKFFFRQRREKKLLPIDLHCGLAAFWCWTFF